MKSVFRDTRERVNLSSTIITVILFCLRRGAVKHSIFKLHLHVVKRRKFREDN